MFSFDFTTDHTPAEWDAAAARYREEAAASRQRATDSWDRSDTDGFLSQHASETMATRWDNLAWLCDQRGVLGYDCLFIDGLPVPTKLVDGMYGPTFAHLASWDPRADVVAWVGYSVAQAPARRQAYFAKKGYSLGEVLLRHGADYKTDLIEPLLHLGPQGIVTADQNVSSN